METAALPLFPPIEPYRQDGFATSDGHRIYYEECGNPHGVPVVVLHGGPGSGCTPTQRRFFDPAHYRIVLFDQRGCGRSQPAGSTEHNTTAHLVSDIEHLRQRLGIASWLVFGGSWGSALALAYASTHPASVRGLVLRGIFLCRKPELDWFFREVRHFFPEAWTAMADVLTPHERHDIVTGYHRRVFGNDTAIAVQAAQAWNAFEFALVSLRPTATTLSGVPDDATALARARVQLHYLIHQCFVADAPLLSRTERLRHLPAIIVQGRYDMVCPPVTAWELHDAWPEARFIIVPEAGHAATEPGICAALIEATEQFRQEQP